MCCDYERGCCVSTEFLVINNSISRQYLGCTRNFISYVSGSSYATSEDVMRCLCLCVAMPVEYELSS